MISPSNFLDNDLAKDNPKPFPLEMSFFEKNGLKQFSISSFFKVWALSLTDNTYPDSKSFNSISIIFS